MTVEAETWLAAQPKNGKGKVGIQLVIAEGQRRGYCICPRPLSRMIDLSGLTCNWCSQTYTRQSWEFWYKEYMP